MIPMIQTTNLETTVIIIPDMVVMVTIPRGVRDGTLEREVPGVLILRRTVMTNMVLQGILRITDLRMGADRLVVVPLGAVPLVVEGLPMVTLTILAGITVGAGTPDPTVTVTTVEGTVTVATVDLLVIPAMEPELICLNVQLVT